MTKEKTLGEAAAELMGTIGALVVLFGTIGVCAALAIAPPLAVVLWFLGKL